MSGEKLNGAWLGHTVGLLPGGSFRMGQKGREEKGQEREHS